MSLPTWTIDTGSNATSYKVPGLIPGKQYQFGVQAKNVVGTGTNTNVTATTSAQTSSSTPSIVPGQVKVFRDNATVSGGGNGSITLSLPSVPSASSYVFVFMGGYGGGGTGSNSVQAPSSATVVSGPNYDGGSNVSWSWVIKNDTSNSYTFTNYNSSDYSTWKIIEVSGGRSYDVAHGVAAETGTTAITWPVSAPASGTNCVRLSHLVSNSTFASVGTSTPSTITTLATDQPSDLYHGGFLVSVPSTFSGTAQTAVTGGQGQAADNPSYVTINIYGGGVPTAVAGVTASNITSAGTRLSWTGTSDLSVSSYIVFYEGGGVSTWTQLGAPLPTTVTSFQVTGLLPTTSYSFKVLAGNPSGLSADSNVASITTLAQNALAVVQTATPGSATTGGAGNKTLTATFSSPTTVGNTIAFFVTGFADTNNLGATQPAGASNWTGVFQDDGNGTDPICAFWTQSVSTAGITNYTFAQWDDECSLHAVEIAGVTSIGSVAHAGNLTYSDNTSVTLPITAPTSTPALGLYLLNMTNTPDSYGTMPSGVTKLSAVTGVSSSSQTYHQGAVFQVDSSVATGNKVIPFTMSTGTQLAAPTYIGVNVYGSSGTVAPGQVTGLTLGTATNSTQVLTWSAASGTVTSYAVQFKLHTDSVWTTFSNTITVTNATVTGLTSGTSYDYRVIAYNGSTAGTASAIVTNSTLSTTPGASTITLGTSTTTTQPLSWSVPTGTVTSYTLQFKRAADSSYTVWASGLTTTTATITGLTPSTSYNYQIIAYNGTNAGPTSTTATGSTQALTAPGQPSAVTLGTPTSTAQPISWTAPAGTVTTYNVNYSSSSSSGPWTTLQGITSTSTTISSLTPSTTYYYQVFALNGSSIGPGSTVVNGATGAASPPGQVTGLAAGTTTSNSISFSWTAPTGNPTSYTLSWKVTGAGSFTNVTGITTNGYTLTGLSPLTNYTIQVTALSYGVAGTTSSAITATTAAAGGGTGTRLVLINGKILTVAGKLVLA